MATDETKRLRLDSDDYLLRKRLPKHLPKRKNDFYVNMRTNVAIQVKKCQPVLDCGQYNHTLVQSFGRAVTSANNMALQLQESNHLDMSCNTSSVEMIDDLEPIGDNRDHNESRTQRRNVSAIHIKLFRRQQTNT